MPISVTQPVLLLAVMAAGLSLCLVGPAAAVGAAETTDLDSIAPACRDAVHAFQACLKGADDYYVAENAARGGNYSRVDTYPMRCECLMTYRDAWFAAPECFGTTAADQRASEGVFATLLENLGHQFRCSWASSSSSS